MASTRRTGRNTVAMPSPPSGTPGCRSGMGARGGSGASHTMPSCSATSAGRRSVARSGIAAVSSSAGISTHLPSGLNRQPWYGALQCAVGDLPGGQARPAVRARVGERRDAVAEAGQRPALAAEADRDRLPADLGGQRYGMPEPRERRMRISELLRLPCPYRRGSRASGLPLLRAIVQVPLDPAPFGVGRLDQRPAGKPRARPARTAGRRASSPHCHGRLPGRT